MTSINGKRRRIGDDVVYFFIYLCAALSVVLLAGIIIYVFVRGIGQVNWQFLTSETSVLRGTVGIAGNLLNTLYIIIITMLIATPVGVGAAVYLNEYAKPGKLVSTIEFATETLAGIPSIIFGLFGMMFFGQTIGFGYSITDTDTHGSASHHQKHTGGTENCTGQLQTRSSRTWSRKMAHYPHNPVAICHARNHHRCYPRNWPNSR